MGCFCIATLCWCYCHCLLSLLHFSIIPSLISFSLVAPVSFFPFVLPFNFHEAATFFVITVVAVVVVVRSCLYAYVCVYMLYVSVWTFCANDWNFVEGEKDVCPSAIYNIWNSIVIFSFFRNNNGYNFAYEIRYYENNGITFMKIISNNLLPLCYDIFVFIHRCIYIYLLLWFYFSFSIFSVFLLILLDNDFSSVCLV